MTNKTIHNVHLTKKNQNTIWKKLELQDNNTKKTTQTHYNNPTNQKQPTSPAL